MKVGRSVLNAFDADIFAAHRGGMDDFVVAFDAAKRAVHEPNRADRRGRQTGQRKHARARSARDVVEDDVAHDGPVGPVGTLAVSEIDLYDLATHAADVDAAHEDI